MTRILLHKTRLGDLAATISLAEVLSRRLRPGDIIALEGDLGAGKTEFCRALIQAMGYGEEVPSPTFTLVQVYEPGPDDQETPPVWHFDLYRLEEPEEAFELGIDEAFDQAVSLIEWPSRLGPYLPQDHLLIRLEIGADGGSREVTFEGNAAWQRRLSGMFGND